MEKEENKIVKVGIFWAVPDKGSGRSVLEFSKRYSACEADSNGFVNYPHSHFEVWNDEVVGLGDDCYKYPRGRVIYDTIQNRHRIFADECLTECDLREIIELFEMEDYEVLRDEHYVCRRCENKGRGAKSALEFAILRGEDKIGENLIEISCGDTKLLVELGKSLGGGDDQFEREILQKPYSAVIISHYHEDHAGLIKYKRDCPIYLGAGADRVLGAMLAYHGEELPENVRRYYDCRPFKIGGIRITPYRCDHSAYGSYMLLFEAVGRSILYTGDFRFHGRQSKDKLLSALPKSVDVLIHEGTNMGKSSCTMTEAELENEAVGIMRSSDGPVFVLQSGTNLDRLVTFYRASKRSGRIFYVDDYVALVASAAGGRIPRPDVFKDVVAFTPRAVRGRRKDLFFEIKNKRGLKGIAGGTKRFTMTVRPSMKEYIKKLLSSAHICGATLIYSTWNGYKEQEYMSLFLSEMQSLGVSVVDLHTSGHASKEEIELLKKTVNAKRSVCVHTQKII